MICPKDLVQMYQQNKIGGGENNDEVYTTWELKVCPVCERKVVEFYSAIVVSSDERGQQIPENITNIINATRK